MLVLRLLAYLLWIPALFAVIAAVILPVVGSGLSRRGRVAASWPQIGCALGHPAEKEAVDEVRDEGADPWPYRSGKLGILLADGVFPAELLDRFAHPGNRTSGYRVQGDVLRPGKPFYVFAVPGELDGGPIMAARYQDVWAISADPMQASLARGGRRTRSWAVRFGLAGLALFAVSVVLLMQAGRAPG